ncbi:hypothetical protein AAMO2058_001164900 [Amorphochlora amoebiformis]
MSLFEKQSSAKSQIDIPNPTPLQFQQGGSGGDEEGGVGGGWGEARGASLRSRGAWGTMLDGQKELSDVDVVFLSASVPSVGLVSRRLIGLAVESRKPLLAILATSPVLSGGSAMQTSSSVLSEAQDASYDGLGFDSKVPEELKDLNQHIYAWEGSRLARAFCAYVTSADTVIGGFTRSATKGARDADIGLAASVQAMICIEGDQRALRDAIMLFEPSSPLIHIVDFAISFQTKRYSEATSQLSLLVRSLKYKLETSNISKKNQSQTSLGTLVGAYGGIIVLITMKTLAFLLLKIGSQPESTPLSGGLNSPQEDDTNEAKWPQCPDMPKRKRGNATFKPYQKPPAPRRRTLTPLEAFEASMLLRCIQASDVLSVLANHTALSLPTGRSVRRSQGGSGTPGGGQEGPHVHHQRGADHRLFGVEHDDETAFAPPSRGKLSGLHGHQMAAHGDVAARALLAVENFADLPRGFLSDLQDPTTLGMASNMQRFISYAKCTLDDLRLTALNYSDPDEGGILGESKPLKDLPGSSIGSKASVEETALYIKTETFFDNELPKQIQDAQRVLNEYIEESGGKSEGKNRLKRREKTSRVTEEKTSGGGKLVAFGATIPRPEDLILFGDEALGSGLHPVVEEALVVKADFQNSFLWRFPEERLAFWKECANEFQKGRVSLRQRILFFSQQVSSHEEELTNQELYQITKFLYKYDRNRRKFHSEGSSNPGPAPPTPSSTSLIDKMPGYVEGLESPPPSLIALRHANPRAFYLDAVPSAPRGLSATARKQKAMDLAHLEVCRVLVAPVKQAPPHVLASSGCHILKTDQLIGHLIEERGSKGTSAIKDIESCDSGLISYLRRISKLAQPPDGSSDHNLPIARDLGLIETALKIAHTPPGATLPSDLPIESVRVICKQNPMLADLRGTGISSGINRSLILDQITRSTWFARRAVRRLHVLYDVAAFLDWSFGDACQMLDINEGGDPASSRSTSSPNASLQGPYLLLRNILAVERKRGGLTLMRKRMRRGGARSESKVGFSPSQELFRRFVDSFSLKNKTVAEVIAESFMSPTSWRAQNGQSGVGSLENEIAYLFGFVDAVTLPTLGAAFERLAGDPRLFPTAYTRATGSRNRGGSSYPLRLCGEIHALSYAYCCYFQALHHAGVSRTTKALCQRLPTLCKYSANYFAHKAGNIQVLSSSQSPTPGRTASSSARGTGVGGGAKGGGGVNSTGEALCAMLLRCMALLATREYEISKSILTTLLTPPQRPHSSKGSSTRVMVAPLLARGRGARAHGGEGAGGSQQALAFVDRLIGALEPDAAAVVRSHLDEYLDCLSLPNEEAMMRVLSYFGKYRFLGRFFLQKGTARVSESAMTSYKQLSTSLQILLEAAQHFSRGGAYNHCLTSLELAALLKQRMAKLHSATPLHRH